MTKQEGNEVTEQKLLRRVDLGGVGAISGLKSHFEIFVFFDFFKTVFFDDVTDTLF